MRSTSLALAALSAAVPALAGTVQTPSLNVYWGQTAGLTLHCELLRIFERRPRA